MNQRKTMMDNNTQLGLFRLLLRARKFEEKASNLFLQNLIKGTNHLAIGQEAIAAGFAMAMEKSDYSFCTYRGHIHTLLKGAPMERLFAELMGKANGILGGKGGSMHLASVEHGAMGSNAIVGAQLCIALGTAWSSQYRGSDQVTVVFFGDGATNIGAFHEALNFAVVMRLPIVFVCENNLYMEYTPIRQVTAVENPAADRASAYGLESIVIEGNEVDQVLTTAISAIEKARHNQGPSLIEAKTYRHQGHSRADPGKYRPTDEVQFWLTQKDPIQLYKQVLISNGHVLKTLEQIEEKIVEEVDMAAQKAISGVKAQVTTSYTNLWADGSSTWHN